MKKTLLLVAGMLFCTSFAFNANAVVLDQDNVAGGEVTIAIDAKKVPGAPTAITFTPSTNVVMVGSSSETEFGIGAYHTQALNKTAGQAYAMVSDSNKMYFMDISDDNADAPVTDGFPTNKAAIEDTGTTWAAM